MAQTIKYKDHNTVIGPGKGTDAAFINDSYKGILRLSPNNSDTFNNQSTAIGAGYTSFQDSIADVLETQYISVSTSDGIILDMRIGTNGAEYTNLNVLGNLYSNYVYLHNNGKFSFNLGDRTEMPISVNTALSDASLSNDYKYVPLDAESVDGCYFLMNETANKRKFVFKNANDIVDLFINQKLLEMDCIPTGSVHFMPIDPARYKALKEKSAGHNVASINNDSLIRDYLPCDGSEYDSTKYPELAKILYGTTVVYWDDTNGKRYTYTNNKSSKFRVPDLRGQFIRSINDMAINHSKKKEVGKWEIDSTVDGETAFKESLNRGEGHYHYIVLDSYNTKCTAEATLTLGEGESYQDKQFTFNSGTGTITTYSGKSTNGFPLARLGNLIARSMPNTGNKWGGCNCDEGTWDIFRTSPISKGLVKWSSPGSEPPYGDGAMFVYGANCGYILSVIPNYNCTTRKLGAGKWVGVSSIQIPREISMNSSYAIGNINYTQHRSSILGTSSKTFRNFSETHGYENAPEFYAMMPFIKI